MLSKYVAGFLLAGCCLMLLPTSGSAQFLDLNLQLDSKLTATTERPLDFGVLSTNSGQVSIQLGDPTMGIFSIHALENQLLLIELELPEQLSHANPAFDQSIPLNLKSRYSFSTGNFAATMPLPQPSGTIIVAEEDNGSPWNTIYIYLYGSVTVQNIPEGLYKDEIILNVEYY